MVLFIITFIVAYITRQYSQFIWGNVNLIICYITISFILMFTSETLRQIHCA